MKYELEIKETGEANIHPYDTSEAFKRGYEMGEYCGNKEYQQALLKIMGLSEVDRKALTGYTTLEAVISDVEPGKLIGVANGE